MLFTTDIMFRIVYLVTRLIIPTMHIDISDFECKMMLYSHYACAAVTFALLAGIAIDRYQQIVHPLKNFYSSRIRRVRTILSLWLYAGLVAMGFIFVGDDEPYQVSGRVPRRFRNHNGTSPETITYRSKTKRCTLAKNSFNSQLAFTPYFILAFLIPLLIIIVSYSAVFRFLSARSKHSINKELKGVSVKMSSDDCSQDALDLAAQSKLEGFPDKHAMDTNRFVVTGIQALLLILGLLVNFAICFVMLRRGKVKKNLSNFFLFNLSLTELLLWLVVLPVAMVVSMAKIETPIPCKILVFSIFTCAGVIFGLLTAIAFDRYTNIVNPLKGIVMEERKMVALAVIWIFAIVTSAPFLYSVRMRVVAMEFESSNDYEDGVITTSTVKISLHNGDHVKTAIIRHTTNVTRTIAATLLTSSIAIGNGSNVTPSLNTTLNCSTKCVLPIRVCDIPANVKGQISCIIFFTFSFVIPLVFIAVAYTKIVRRLWVRCRSTDAKGTAAKAKLRAVRMLVLVVVTFLLTDGPWTIGCLLYSFRTPGLMSSQSHFTAVAIVSTLFYASAVLTPTIHAIHSSTVQREIVAIVCCRFREKTRMRHGWTACAIPSAHHVGDHVVSHVVS
ncbi:hypothetical protein QZH41_001315 [Actinostola sp. cb2023]|nr:hypothetical protein QZH41_001315 [Actinostola sp. cb2023]